MKTVNDLFSRFTDLRAYYGERDARYLSNWYAYCGDYDHIFENYAKDALTLSRGRTSRTIQKWNLVRPIVDTHRILINQMPTIEVPPPVLGEQMASLKADKMEKILYALWDMGNMERKHGESSFNIALNWASVWQVAWDEEKDIPVAFVRSPGETYPVMKRGGEEVSYCFFRWEEDVESLAEKYPQVKSLLTRNRQGGYSLSTLEVVEYVDETERLLLVGGEVKSLLEGEGGKHELGQCPVFLCAGAYIPGELFPPGPIDQLVAMNDHLNRFQSKLGDAIEETLFGWHDVTGEGAKDVVLNTGPGAVNYLEGDLKHEYTQPQAPPAQAFGHVDQVQRYMRNLANWPEVASGEMDGSIITGKAVSRLQGIMAAQAAECQSNLKNSLQKVNNVMLKMMETYRGDKKFELYATDGVSLTAAPGRKRNFGVAFVPSEDIQHYYRNTLNYSPFGSDMNQSIQIGMQLVDARIFPRSWLRNLIPGGSDAEGMAAEIEEEDRRRMQLEIDLQTQAQERIMQAQVQQQAQMQALQQGQGGTGASAPATNTGSAPQPPGGLPPNQPPGGEMVGNAMLMPGGQPQMMGMGEPLTGTAESFPIPYTPLKPFGPAVAELAGTGVHGQGANEAALSGAGIQPGEQPGANAVTLDEATEILSGIDKLKGALYLMGDIVQRGFTEGSVQVGITKAIDKATVSNAVRGTKLAGRIVFETSIPTGAVQVAGPKAA